MTYRIDHGMARWQFWIDTSPFPAMRTSKIFNNPAPNRRETYLNQVAIEHFSVQGPRYTYGLLGAEFFADSRDEFSVFLVDDYEGSPYKSTLVNFAHNLRRAMSVEYVDPIAAK